LVQCIIIISISFCILHFNFCLYILIAIIKKESKNNVVLLTKQIVDVFSLGFFFFRDAGGADGLTFFTSHVVVSVIKPFHRFPKRKLFGVDRFVVFQADSHCFANNLVNRSHSLGFRKIENVRWS